MRVNNNLSALTAFNALDNVNNQLYKIIQQLSSGLRINSAADDAAGFAISEKMRAQISGLDRAIQNSQDGISLLQTAEGALEQTTSMLHRMRELSLQAANDSLTSQDRQYIQLEIDQLKDQIDRIANTTQFNEKRILDGSSGALWASSDLNVKVRVNGGLTHIDRFGQKVSSEGNYKIEIKADPGQTQVQKSNIFDIQELRKVISYTQEPHEININDGVDNTGETQGKGWNFSDNLFNITQDGTYYLVGNLDANGVPIQTTNGIQVASGVKATIFLRDINISPSGFGLNVTGAEVDLYLDPGQNGNDIVIDGSNVFRHCSAVEVPAGSTLRISSINGDYNTAGTLRVTGTTHGAGIGGSCSGTADAGNIEIYGGTIIATGGMYAAGIGGGSYGGATGGDCGTITIYGGDVTATGGLGGAGIGTGTNARGANYSSSARGSINILGGTVNATGGQGNYPIPANDPTNYPNYPQGNTGQGAGIGGGGGFSSANMTINIAPGTTTPSGYVPVGSGEFADDDTTYTQNADPLPAARTVPDLPIYNKPEYAEAHQLSDIKQFYNSEGVLLVDSPQKITITQGNGDTADVMLYKTDSIYDVAEKINNAISEKLGQGRYTDNKNKFCTISDGTQGTSESIYESEPIYDDNGRVIGHNVHATMLVRSGIPGKSGELSFSGDEDLLKALGLNTIQESSETRYTASIYDAHSGKVISAGAKVTGNVINDALTGVDIEFDAMAGIKSSWDENTKRYVLSSGEKYTATIHLKDNGITFQTGANKGEEFFVQLGDMSSQSLGISGVNATTRESAARSVGIIDRAISRVSSQRAKIGSYENALEHTMENLTTTSTNLTSAESRIRDADMSKVMMEFVKLQILNQSGTSMLAQANQLPQSVLSIMQ